MKSSSKPESGKSAVGVVLVGLGGLGLQWHTIHWVWEAWWTDGWFLGYALGPAVLVVAATLLWRARPWREPQPSPWGSALIVIALLLGAWAQAQGLYSVAAGTLLLLAGGIAWRALGFRAVSRLLPALVCLALAIPIQHELYGGAVAAQGVALLAVALTTFVGSPVLQQSGYELMSGSGFTFYIPVVTLAGGTEYRFDPGCGGIQKIRAMLVLALLALPLSPSSWGPWPVMLLTASLLAFLSKVLDVAAVLALTPSIGEEEALALYHGWLSLLTFAAAVAGLLLASHLLGVRRTIANPVERGPARGTAPGEALRWIDSALG